MAKLTRLPSQAIISGYKGKIDYYYYMGIPVARIWPRSPGHVRTPAVMAQWSAFAYSAHEWNNLSLEERESYRTVADLSGLSPRDAFMRAYITGLM